MLTDFRDLTDLRDWTDQGDTFGNRPSGTKPCDGPLCRQSPSAPIPVPVPSSPNLNRYHHDAVCSAEAMAEMDRLQTPLYRDDSFDLPTGYGVPIERPPKAACSIAA